MFIKCVIHTNPPHDDREFLYQLDVLGEEREEEEKVAVAMEKEF